MVSKTVVLKGTAPTVAQRGWCKGVKTLSKALRNSGLKSSDSPRGLFKNAIQGPHPRPVKLKSGETAQASVFLKKAPQNISYVALAESLS